MAITKSIDHKYNTEYWQTYDTIGIQNTLHTWGMDTVLRHVQDVKVTNRFGNMDAVLRRTQDAKITNKLKIMFKAHCLWTRIDLSSL